MYKVFFKDSYFLLTDKRKSEEEGTHSWKHQDFQSTKRYIEELLNTDQPFRAILYGDNLEELLSVFKSCFLYVKAAGGIVQQHNQILLIKRLGKYDLPKGHLEPNETIEECAIREVEEECGIQNVQIIAPLTSTLHIYHREGNWFLKKTYWYKMSCPTEVSPTPQTEEEIEAVFWWSLQKLKEIKNDTYPSLWEVFKQLTSSF